MKRIFLFWVISATFLSYSVAAQVSTIAIQDTTFAAAAGGKVETSLSNFGDEATCMYVLFDSKITVLGKVGTADSSRKHFGAIRLNPDGTFDSTFGMNGTAVLSWDSSDYPNALYMQMDSSVVAAGASMTSLNYDVPAVFRITKTGVPDSTFGGDGRIMFPDATARGSFTSLFLTGNNYVAAGIQIATDSESLNAFYAVRFHSDGTLDSTFGTVGKASIPIRIERSVNAFPSANGTVAFVGVSSSNEIVFGRLTSNGEPDSTFGPGGVVHSGIISPSALPVVSAIQQDYKILLGIPIEIGATRPFTLARFSTNGALDSTYGTNGYATIPIAATATGLGINIANNGKTVINGAAAEGALEACATARIDQHGIPDPTFNLTGMDVIDVDHGEYSNYLIQFDAIGFKRYIGFGGSIQNGKTQFLVARFKDDTLSNGVQPLVQHDDDLTLYPNPASSILSIEHASNMEGLRILDALGRPVSFTLKQNSIDISLLPNGVYYLEDKNGMVRSFAVSH